MPAVIVVPDTLPQVPNGVYAPACVLGNITKNFVEDTLHACIAHDQGLLVVAHIAVADQAVIVVPDTVQATAYVFESEAFL